MQTPWQLIGVIGIIDVLNWNTDSTDSILRQHKQPPATIFISALVRVEEEKRTRLEVVLEELEKSKASENQGFVSFSSLTLTNRHDQCAS